MCSSQPGIKLEVKEKLWTAAVRAAQAVGYVGAGGVERRGREEGKGRRCGQKGKGRSPSSLMKSVILQNKL